MTPDEIVRRAALLLRSGAVPVQEFVEGLDDATRRKVRRTIATLPETLQSRENAARLAAGTVLCVRPAMKGQKVHAYVRRGRHGAYWTACGALGEDASFQGSPTCETCLKSLASGRVRA